MRNYEIQLWEKLVHPADEIQLWEKLVHPADEIQSRQELALPPVEKFLDFKSFLKDKEILDILEKPDIHIYNESLSAGNYDYAIALCREILKELIRKQLNDVFLERLINGETTTIPDLNNPNYLEWKNRFDEAKKLYEAKK